MGCLASNNIGICSPFCSCSWGHLLHRPDSEGQRVDMLVGLGTEIKAWPRSIPVQWILTGKRFEGNFDLQLYRCS